VNESKALNNIEQERKTVGVMIQIYCQGQHDGKPLCPICLELSDYVNERLDRCPFGDEKPTCKNCKVHCYEPVMRERIREVMRYAGPRMIFRYPILAIRHLLRGIKY
jgi:hypothetical protein